MASINLNKIEKEFSKGTVTEQVAAYNWVKSFVTLKVMEHQKELAEKANDLQLTLDSIAGPSAANL
jgi:hypothetical protein